MESEQRRAFRPTKRERKEEEDSESSGVLIACIVVVIAFVVAFAVLIGVQLSPPADEPAADTANRSSAVNPNEMAQGQEAAKAAISALKTDSQRALVERGAMVVTDKVEGTPLKDRLARMNAQGALVVLQGCPPCALLLAMLANKTTGPLNHLVIAEASAIQAADNIQGFPSTIDLQGNVGPGFLFMPEAHARELVASIQQGGGIPKNPQTPINGDDRTKSMNYLQSLLQPLLVRERVARGLPATPPPPPQQAPAKALAAIPTADAPENRTAGPTQPSLTVTHNADKALQLWNEYSKDATKDTGLFLIASNCGFSRKMYDALYTLSLGRVSDGRGSKRPLRMIAFVFPDYRSAPSVEAIDLVRQNIPGQPAVFGFPTSIVRDNQSGSVSLMQGYAPTLS
jgi:hypothetical protein